MRRLILPGSFVWLHALPVTVIVLAFYFYWFAVADRYIVFLYYHDMGPLFPDTSPFSAVTAGRYWMTGLVAGGVVLLLYTAVNGLLGRLLARHHPPEWWRVWVVCAGPLLIGILLMTMSLNQPRLPLPNAAQTTCAALIGVAFGLMPGRLAAMHPATFGWLAAYGVAISFMLLALAPMENIIRWWSEGAVGRVWLIVAGMTIGIVGLLILSALRARLHQPVPPTAAVLVAGACVTYLLLPLVHHLFVGIVEGYFYISTADNFFASSVIIQLAGWGVAAMIVWLVTQIFKPGQG